MQIIKKLIFLFTFAVLVSACGSTNKMTDQTMVEEVIVEETALPETVVTSKAEEKIYELPKYNESATRHFDLLDTKLDIKFDWANQYVIGKANITSTPLFYAQSKMMLDAVGFDIKEIKVNNRVATYDYDGKDITINLDREYKRGEKVNVYIDYIAKPNEAPIGGSAAITSDKGLFFINPLGEEADKPMQIWTQGETESNSKWFPTFDKPNERTTQEISLTVQDKYKTLSNGKKVSSNKNPDGTRTDVWKQTKPHAPYLFFVGVGDFAEVEDSWNGMPLTYMVEHKYKEHAKEIFDHTPEMLSFFSEKLEYPYPWDKYSQVIMRDYVSGAMENTSAVIFGEFVQKTGRELIDNDNDYIVAHEMMHHWFGDLVTCESWANLTLNEGFANYSEYLWAEHHDGAEAADFHRVNELRGYLGSARQQGTHPLIHFGYDDKEEMFDAHSYNKGGLILHMLRNIIGDEAFFAGCNKYLKDNEYTAVEADELRIAMEDITGMDFNWFWDQWFFAAGHPELEVTHTYDAADKTLILDVIQKHEPTDEIPAIFVLPMTVDLYDENGTLSTYNVTVNNRNQSLVLENVTSSPSAVVMDGTASILMTIDHAKTEAELMAQAKYATKFLHVYSAVNNLKEDASFAILQDEMLAYPHYSIRAKAIKEMDVTKVGASDILMKLATNDEHSKVRAAALNALTNIEGTDLNLLVSKIMKTEQSYPVLGKAVSALYDSNPEKALEYTKILAKEDTDMLVGSIADIYGKTGDAQYLPFFEDKLETVGLYSMFDFYGKYYSMLSTQDVPAMQKAAEKLGSIAGNLSTNMYRKFVSMNTLNRIKGAMTEKQNEMPNDTNISTALAKIKTIVDDIKSRETNKMLLERYKSF